MNNKIKKKDLTILLEEIQKEYVTKTQNNIKIEVESTYYGKYEMEMCFVTNLSKEELIDNSLKMMTELKKLSFYFKSYCLKEIPQEITNINGLKEEIKVYFLSTDRLNNLPLNDDLRLCKFLTKYKEDILKNINHLN